MRTPLLSKIPQTLTSQTPFFTKSHVSILRSQKIATVSEMGHSDQRDGFQISIKMRFLYKVNNQ